MRALILVAAASIALSACHDDDTLLPSDDEIVVPENDSADCDRKAGECPLVNGGPRLPPEDVCKNDPTDKRCTVLERDLEP